MFENLVTDTPGPVYCGSPPVRASKAGWGDYWESMSDPAIAGRGRGRIGGPIELWTMCEMVHHLWSSESRRSL